MVNNSGRSNKVEVTQYNCLQRDRKNILANIDEKTCEKRGIETVSRNRSDENQHRTLISTLRVREDTIDRR